MAGPFIGERSAMIGSGTDVPGGAEDAMISAVQPLIDEADDSRDRATRSGRVRRRASRCPAESRSRAVAPRRPAGSRGPQGLQRHGRAWRAWSHPGAGLSSGRRRTAWRWPGTDRRIAVESTCRAWPSVGASSHGEPPCCAPRLPPSSSPPPPSPTPPTPKPGPSSRRRRRAPCSTRRSRRTAGAEALRAIEVVRLRLEGQTFPRLQMTTPAPPFEGGSFDETLLLDLEKNRLRLDQKAGGFGFDGDNTVTIVGRHRQHLRQPREDRHADPCGAGDPAAVHPVPPPAAEPAAAPGARPHELAALPRRGRFRGAAARGRHLRDARHAAGRALCRCRDRAWCRSTS